MCGVQEHIRFIASGSTGPGDLVVEPVEKVYGKTHSREAEESDLTGCATIDV